MQPILRVIHDVSVILSRAAFQATGEVKSDLASLISDLESDPNYDIPQREDFIREMKHALDHFYRREDREGGGDLSRINYLLWEIYFALSKENERGCE